MMYPNGRYFYTTQHQQRPSTQKAVGQAKVAARTGKSAVDVWLFLQLGAATAIVVAAVVVLTSLAG